MKEKKNNFTFICLTYNHECYILEHLESIKYLVENFGDEFAIDLIIADDASSDRTTEYCKSWLFRNDRLFNKVMILSDGINRGTCKNLTRAIQHLSTEYCKITAGDDVYSFENIFVELVKINGNHILSGFPLRLLDGDISIDRFDLFNLVATNVIYRKASYLTRLKRINFFNSPNIVYAKSALLNSEVVDFVDQFSVTEDYPLQIKMAELFHPLRYVQIRKILVYYRRTSGSTYLTKNTAFNRDKLAIFTYLLLSESTFFGKLLLQNRKYCFRIKRPYLKRVLNLNLYLYGSAVILHILKIMAEVRNIKPQLDQHQKHYEMIAVMAKKYDSQFSAVKANSSQPKF